MKLTVICLAMLLSGCKSFIHFMPSTDCEYVKYERVLNQVHVEADCQL
jgi:uncharacterized protein YceK